MTATVPGPTRRGRAWPVLIVAIAIVAVAASAVRGDGRRSGPPFDPRSTDPDGTLAYVELLGRVGVVASAGGVPRAGTPGTVVLLADDLDTGASAALEDWVAAGGTLVVADVGSPFSPPPTDSARLRGPAGECSIGAIGDARVLDLDLARGFDPAGAPACFPVGGGSLVATRSLGEGLVVAVGDRTLFRNDRLAVADHAVLAVRVAQLPGGPVRVLVPAPGAEGGDRLVDLVSPGVWAFLAVGAFAFVVHAVARAWRFGRPVAEHQPVAIDGSELVVATGRLLERSRAGGRSALLLHDELRRWLAGRFGIPPDASIDAAVRPLAGELAGSGVPGTVVRHALTRPAVTTDAELVAYAVAVAELRRALGEGTGGWTR